MKIAKLYYLRELKKERDEIKKRLDESYRLERTKGSNRQHLNNLLKEVDDEIARVKPEIIQWIAESDLYDDQKADCMKYFVGGCTRMKLDNQNFMRDLQHYLYKCWAQHGRTQD